MARLFLEICLSDRKCTTKRLSYGPNFLEGGRNNINGSIFARGVSLRVFRDPPQSNSSVASGGREDVAVGREHRRFELAEIRFEGQ